MKVENFSQTYWEVGLKNRGIGGMFAPKTDGRLAPKIVGNWEVETPPLYISIHRTSLDCDLNYCVFSLEARQVPHFTSRGRSVAGLKEGKSTRTAYAI